MSIFTKEFAKAVLERAIKTFAETLLALFVVGQSILDVDWLSALSVAALAALGSILASLVSAQVGNSGPSLTSESLPKHAA